MNKQEIENYNRLCADFLGWEQYLDVNERFYGNWKPNTTLEKPWGIRVERLFFDSDWNWIMEVVEAIEKNKYLLDKERPYYLTIDNNYCGIFFNRWNDKGKDFNGTKQIVSIKGNSKKEAVVEAINQFLIWYNSKKL